FAGHRRCRAGLTPADNAARFHTHEHIVRSRKHALGTPDRPRERQTHCDDLDAMNLQREGIYLRRNSSTDFASSPSCVFRGSVTGCVAPNVGTYAECLPAPPITNT